MTRRTLLQLSTVSGLLRPSVNGVPVASNSILEPWHPGVLDIHHLAYGRGNCMFILAPDGTTMLIDAGATNDALDVSSEQMPDTRLRPGEWIATYVLRHMAAAKREELDYALLTHLHPDHIGDVTPESPRSSSGEYRLTGIADVSERMKIVTLVDRAFPNYRYPTSPEAPFAKNYLDYVRYRQHRGEACEQIQVGSSHQLRLTRHRRQFLNFSIRNLAANGQVWTGLGETTYQQFPALGTLSPSDYPTENMCSIALRRSYGPFSYFTGGDLTCDTNYGEQPWRDIESVVAGACGPVSVAVADHHAYFDAAGVQFVRKHSSSRVGTWPTPPSYHFAAC